MMINAINDVGNTKLVVDRNVAITIQYDPVSPAFDTVRYDLTGARTGLPHGSLPQEWALVKDADFTPPENSADPNTLKEFIVWSLNRKPKPPGDKFRDHYRMLGTIWSRQRSGRRLLAGRQQGIGEGGNSGPAVHGSKFPHDSWIGTCAPKSPRRTEGDEVLQEGQELLHVLGMDSCLMGMAEVAYQVQDFAQTSWHQRASSPLRAGLTGTCWTVSKTGSSKKNLSTLSLLAVASLMTISVITRNRDWRTCQ